MENLGIIFGTVGTVLGCMLARKKYNFSFKKGLFYSFAIVLLGILECKVMSLFQSWLLNMISGGEIPIENGIRFIGVIVFEPLFILLLVYLSGEKYRKLMDFAIPGNLAALLIGKLSCHIEGCCYGIPFENGIYNKFADANVFPVQLCESASSLIAIAAVYLLLYKCNKIRKGTLFPVGAIIYCITRFIWEEFRYYDNNWQLDFFFGLNTWQFWCVISVITCVIWLIILYTNPKYAECDFSTKENAPFTVISERIRTSVIRFRTRNEKNIVHHKKKKK